MSDIALNVQRREPGRKTAKQLRRQGLVPGIFYVNGTEPIPFAVHPLNLRSIVYTKDAKMVQLHVEGESKSYPCVLKDITFDPITDKIVHLDLHGLTFDKVMHFEVPVVLVGNSAGVRAGGLADVILQKLHIECLPGDMPEHIEVDISNLNIGDSIHVRDLSFDKFKVTNSPDASVVVITATRGSKAAAGAGSSEPELVGQKGKKDDE